MTNGPMLVPRRWPPVLPGDVELLGESLRSGVWTDGPYTAELELRWAGQVGAAHCVAFNSCTSAIHAALAAMGVTASSTVAAPAFGFVGTVTGLLHLGATIAWVDVDPLTGLIDPDRVPAGIDLVLAVDMAGRPHELPRTMFGSTPMLTDACQAHGAEVDFAPVGASGTHCWSFSSAKMVPAPDGGAVTTDDGTLAARLRMLRDYGTDPSDERGRSVRPVLDSAGHNWRITESSAALIVNRLRMLSAWVVRATEAVSALEECIDRLPEGLVYPGSCPSGQAPAWHKFRVGVDTGQPRIDERLRDRLLVALTKHGVPHSQWGTVLPDSPAFAGRRLLEDGRVEPLPLRGARRLESTTLVIGDERRPLHTWRTDEIDQVCDAFASAWQETIEDEHVHATS